KQRGGGFSMLWISTFPPRLLNTRSFNDSGYDDADEKALNDADHKCGEQCGKKNNGLIKIVFEVISKLAYMNQVENRKYNNRRKRCFRQIIKQWRHVQNRYKHEQSGKNHRQLCFGTGCI